MSELSPEELRELRRLHVHAGRRVDSLFAGEYRSAIRGQGMEFEEVRNYVPGDDIRHIDWNVTARTGEPFIKVFREERQQVVMLVVDVSGSTRLGSGGRDGRTRKARQVARVAGGIAYAGIRNRDKVGLVTFTDEVEQFLTPRASRGHTWAVIRHCYAGEAQGRGTDISGALDFLSRTWKRRSVVVVVSDFLDDGPWEQRIAALSRRHQVHAVVVHDKLDNGLGALGGLVEVEDAETGHPVLVDASTFFGRRSAEERVKRLQRTGANAVGLSTEQDAFRVLHEHFQRVGGRRTR